MNMTFPFEMTGLNPYDIQKNFGLNPLCYNSRNIETFLILDNTCKALHVSKKLCNWALYNMGINLKFHVCLLKYFILYMANMLNGGIQELIYAGGVEFIRK